MIGLAVGKIELPSSVGAYGWGFALQKYPYTPAANVEEEDDIDQEVEESDAEEEASPAKKKQRVTDGDDDKPTPLARRSARASSSRSVRGR